MCISKSKGGKKEPLRSSLYTEDKEPTVSYALPLPRVVVKILIKTVTHIANISFVLFFPPQKKKCFTGIFSGWSQETHTNRSKLWHLALAAPVGGRRELLLDPGHRASHTCGCGRCTAKRNREGRCSVLFSFFSVSK